jgi:hypothetical protein
MGLSEVDLLFSAVSDRRLSCHRLGNVSQFLLNYGTLSARLISDARIWANTHVRQYLPVDVWLTNSRYVISFHAY